MAFQNESQWFRLHLPALALPASWGLVGLDGGSDDDSALVFAAHGGVVHTRKFDWHFARHMNALIDVCRAEGYDAILRLDPDELMFVRDMVMVTNLLREYKAVRLPRYNFERDRHHVLISMYPDWQTRAVRLEPGVEYDGAVHETFECAFREMGWREDNSPNPGPREIVRAPSAHIYHYEGLRRDAARAMKHHNYAALQSGGAVERDLSAAARFAGQGAMDRFCVPFTGAQPLDPREVGALAPFGAVAV